MVSGFTWIISIVILGAWWYLDFDLDFLFIVGSFHLLFTLPALYLYIEYSFKNFGEQIEINSNEIVVRKFGRERSIKSAIFQK